jgi:hypothetical protein
MIGVTTPSIGIRGADLLPATTPLQLNMFESEARRTQRERLNDLLMIFADALDIMRLAVP